MIQIYIWEPAGVLIAVEHRILPDFGHTAMAVDRPDGRVTYISYWPEIDAPGVELLKLIKTRTKRHPESYEEESTSSGPYMQRHADHHLEVVSIKEERVNWL